MQEGRIDIETDVQSANMTGSINAVPTISGTINAIITMSGSLNIAEGYWPDVYDEEYEVTPRLYPQELQTVGKLMLDDVTVYKIPVVRTSNLQGGLTVLIG